MSVRNWVTQFGSDYAVPEAVTAMLKDVSWGNDMCPSFVWPERDPSGQYHPRGWVLWVDHPEAADREVEGKRFLIVYEDQELGVQWEALATDSETEALAYMVEHRHESHVLCPKCGKPNPGLHDSAWCPECRNVQTSEECSAG